MPRSSRALARDLHFEWQISRCARDDNYSARRRGTTWYTMSPFASSSSDLVVSFFSRDDERSRGNSFSTRAYFAATRTPRYLLAAWLAISPGVKTRMYQLDEC